MPSTRKKYTVSELIDLTLPSAGTFQIDSDSDAFSFCERLSKSHYENFPVGSLLIPLELRPHFYSIYAFSRIADDLGDETGELSTEKRLELLSNFENLLHTECPNHPVFRALSLTISKYTIPTDPFSRLITAFKSDIQFTQYQTFEELFGYCHNSANPVGELLLRLFGEWNENTAQYSNDICTALQLLNFWQDISRDLPIKRYYIPVDLLEKYSLSIENDKLVGSMESKQSLLDQLFYRTNQLFERGIRLLTCIESKRLRMELSLIIGSAMTLQTKVKSIGVDLITTRITLSVLDIVPITHRALKLYNSY
jgi:squalene synthase HpnC